MYGLAGMIGWDDSDYEQSQIAEAMQNVLNKSDPDQQGLYIDNDAVRIHTRPTVVNLGNGRQTMILNRGDE